MYALALALFLLRTNTTTNGWEGRGVLQNLGCGKELPTLDVLDEGWDVTCQGSVPVASRCFLDSEDYESFLRNVYSLPCDMDTLCAIGGGIAEEFYKGTGFAEEYLLKEYLDDTLYEIVNM